MTGSRRHVRRGVLPAESEAAFMQKVVSLAGFCGWLVYHTHRSDRSPAGFPDLVMVRGSRLLFAECKPETVRRRARVADVMARPAWLQIPDVTDQQAVWLDALLEVAIAAKVARGMIGDGAPRIEVAVWRPSDWEEIEEALRR